MKRVWAAAVVAAGIAASAAAWAASGAELDGRIKESTEVLKEYFLIPEQRIPKGLLQNARAVAIFPSLVKAGFVLAGQYGNGIVIRRDESGNWSAPAFYRMSGAGIGFQIGGQASDAILVINSDRGADAFLRNKVTLGADASVSAGPVGRDAEAKTDWQLKSGIFSYSRSKGFFAGVSLDGMVVRADENANQVYYGTNAETVLRSSQVKPTDEGKRFADALTAYAR